MPDVVFAGGAAEYLAAEEREVMCEAGARTGKSFSVMWKHRICAETYPGSRILFTRATRASMSTTIIPDFNELVLGHRHECYPHTLPENTNLYRWKNGSTIDLIGLDNPNRILSGQWDRIVIFQAEEAQREAIMKLLTRLSCTNTPYQQLTLDVNPQGERHHLNQRGMRGRCVECNRSSKVDQPCPDCGGRIQPYIHRIAYRLQDNPKWFDHAKGAWRPEGIEYIQTLNTLEGRERDRLLNHRWTDEEGLVLNTWDSAVHLISGHLVNDGHAWYLQVLGWDQPVELRWFGAGVDWGFSGDPSAINVLGFDASGRAFRVAHWQRVGKQLEEVANVCADFWERFGVRYFAVDPSRPDLVEKINYMLTTRGSRSAEPLAVSANNSLVYRTLNGSDLTGIDLFRWYLRSKVDGQVRLYFLRGTLEGGPCPTLVDREKPTCVEEEIPEWKLSPEEDGKPSKDRPDPTCRDDGCDSVRYALNEAWGRDLGDSPSEEEALFARGTAGSILRHEERDLA